jgi:chloramphenicol 3-O phosphotransferase
MKKAIIVNGVSSAGCTSLVKRFCELSEGEYIGLHVDEFTNTLPKDMWKRCCDSDAGWAEIGIAFNKHISSVLKRHDKIIADAFYRLSVARDHLFNKLGRKNIFFVQMYCCMEELERREIARGDRPKGLARSQFNDVYSCAEYDFLLDSSDIDIDQCVSKLIKELSNHGCTATAKSRRA